MCEKNILIPKREMQTIPVHKMKSIINNDLDKSFNPIEKIIKVISRIVDKTLALIIFIMSQTLVYRHIPLYRANILKDKIFSTTKTVRFLRESSVLTSLGGIKSNRNSTLKYSDVIIKTESHPINKKRFLFKRFFI